MKAIKKSIIALLLMSGTMSFVMAGNENRAGQAGAMEILVNPWARSSGWGCANSGSVRGLESINLNVAGIAFTKKTELLFSYTSLAQGSGVEVNAFGFSQKLGESNAIAMTVTAMSFGEIEITTTENPEGGIGTYSPVLANIALSYAHMFSNSIYGGITVRVISESMSNLNASGVAFDAGIQYVTGEREQIKFGISLNNVGPTMTFRGDGLSFKADVLSTGVSLTAEQRSQSFELPSCVRIGGSYDFRLSELHRLTLAGTFTSNSFSKDQYHIGLEYSLKELFLIRGGYVYESGLFDPEMRTTIYTGPTAGISFDVPYNKNGSKFTIDYSYKMSNLSDATHRIGARVNL
jgi:hypothetical protein